MIPDSYLPTRNFFNRIDAIRVGSHNYEWHTKAGFYAPSPPDIFLVGLQYARTQGLIPEHLRGLDAGGGDSRLGHVGEAEGVPMTTVEYDANLVTKAKRYSVKLKEIIPDKPEPIILQGNFLDNQTYLDAGITFSDHGLLFNYVNGYRRLGAKMVSESPEEAVMMLLDGNEPADIEGLIEVDRLDSTQIEEMIEEEGLKIDRNLFGRLCGDVINLHFYVKLSHPFIS